MNEVLKQRLVGALILVALGVVFWPIIFVEPEGERSVQERTMPSRPNVDTSPVAVPDVAGLRPSAELPAREEALAAGDPRAGARPRAGAKTRSGARGGGTCGTSPGTGARKTAYDPERGA